MKNTSEKEFIDKECKDCINKLNDKDLCSIVRKIDGSYGCDNKKERYKNENNRDCKKNR